MDRRSFIAAVLLGGGGMLKVPVAQAAPPRVWSRERTRDEVRAACRRYGVTGSDARWLEAVVDDIVYRGAAESHGDTHCRYGRHAGIVQFNTSWRPNAYERRLAREDGHASDWRLSGRASIHRLVRVFRDGGRGAIRRHWRATLGR